MGHPSIRILLPLAAVALVVISLATVLFRATAPSSAVPALNTPQDTFSDPLSRISMPPPTPSPPPFPSHADVSQSLKIENGRVLQGELFSTTLQFHLPYRVFLPADYESSTEPYPVVYLLHGNGGTYVEWADYNHAALYADAMISEGRIRPMILVMPEGDHSYFMNHAVDGQRWGDYLALEMVDYIDSHFRTVATRDGRAVGGLSMGGTGALQLAFNYPERFSIAQANSPSLRLDLRDVPEFFGDSDYYAGFDPLSLAYTRAEQIRDVEISMDIGEQDEWFGAAERLHEALEENAVEHRFITRYGYHWTTYWIEHGPEYLSIYSRAFDRRLGELPLSPTQGAEDRVITLSANPLPKAESLRKEIQAVVRGARVYAALPDSPYMARTAREAIAALRERDLRREPARFAKTVALFEELEAAVDRMDIGAMRHLSDQLEGALDEEVPDSP